MKIAGAILGGLAVLLIVWFGGTALGFWHYKFWAPKFEDARRDVFENTRSYNQGKLQELSKYAYEYKTTNDPEAKSAIAFTIRHKFADYDDQNLSPELRAFLHEVK
jgi:hypothetical protein